MTEEKKPPPFYCPTCGQKHRADLSDLTGMDDAMARVTCAGCGIALGVTLKWRMPMPSSNMVYVLPALI